MLAALLPITAVAMAPAGITTMAVGVGWPEAVSVDLCYRIEPQIGLGGWIGLGGPLGSPSSLYATPAAYLRYYLTTASSSRFLQFGTATQLAGPLGPWSINSGPLLLASLGYEWRLPSRVSASVDLGGAFSFAPQGNTPSLRIGLRIGYEIATPRRD